MAHINTNPGEYDFCVEVFITCSKNGIAKILLRKHDKYGIWLGVGGHIEKDENPTQAIHREVKEEVGLDITIVDTNPDRWHGSNGEKYGVIPPFDITAHPLPDLPGHRHLAMIYFATSNTMDVVPEKETDEWRWLTKEELLANEVGAPPEILHYATAALNYIPR